MVKNQRFRILTLLTAVISVQIITQISGTGYYLTQMTMAAWYSLLVTGLCLLMGYAGQISLGHAGFFAIGGYVSALLTTYNFMPYTGSNPVSILQTAGILHVRHDLYGAELLTMQPWAACLCALSAAVLIAWIVGGPVLRLKGHYLAMATLGFGIIVYAIVLGSSIFGEADGLSDVPPFKLFPGLTVSGSMSMRIENYYIAYGMVILGMALVQNLVNSRVGRALRSIHGAENAANAMGINTSQYKLRTFVLSAAMAALAGIFMTHYNGGIGPSEASVMKSVRYVAIVAIGGMANLWGTLIMSLVLNFLSLRGVFGSYDDAVFGTILILIMLFAPDGILRINLSLLMKRISGRSGDIQGENT